MVKTRAKKQHWAVELHERFLLFASDGYRISSECTEDQVFAKNVYKAMADQAGRCAEDLYLWSPSNVKKMIREKENSNERL